jgi:hypothetical protein
MEISDYQISMHGIAYLYVLTKYVLISYERNFSMTMSQLFLFEIEIVSLVKYEKNKLCPCLTK